MGLETRVLSAFGGDCGGYFVADGSEVYFVIRCAWIGRVGDQDRTRKARVGFNQRRVISQHGRER